MTSALVSYRQDNEFEKRFYASFGFKEKGIDAEPLEMVAVFERRRSEIAWARVPELSAT